MGLPVKEPDMIVNIATATQALANPVRFAIT
jgi:hypothetical protein